LNELPDSDSRSAFYLAQQAVATGSVDCALALGFEKMKPGSLGANFNDRANPMEKTAELMEDVAGTTMGPFAAQVFGNGAKEYCDRYGATRRHIAEIAAKNHRHSVVNPYSQFRNNMTAEEVLNDMQITPFVSNILPFCLSGAILLFLIPRLSAYPQHVLSDIGRRCCSGRGQRGFCLQAWFAKSGDRDCRDLLDDGQPPSL
jgi:Thiolase, N-terminal domain